MVQAQEAVPPPPPPPETDSGASHRRRPAALGLAVSVSALVSSLAKKAGEASKKLAPHKRDWCRFKPRSSSPAGAAAGASSPLMRPKKLLSSISNKAIAFVHRTRKGSAHGEDSEADSEEFGFGDGGVWQRSILMGDKCQPLDFSGVIYYDESGKKVDQLPLRSPRASPLPGYLARARPEEGRVSKFDFGGLGK